MAKKIKKEREFIPIHLQLSASTFNRLSEYLHENKAKHRNRTQFTETLFVNFLTKNGY